jgi:hypothetical protein
MNLCRGWLFREFQNCEKLLARTSRELLVGVTSVEHDSLPDAVNVCSAIRTNAEVFSDCCRDSVRKHAVELFRQLLCDRFAPSCVSVAISHRHLLESLSSAPGTCSCAVQAQEMAMRVIGEVLLGVRPLQRRKLERHIERAE